VAVATVRNVGVFFWKETYSRCGLNALHSVKSLLLYSPEQARKKKKWTKNKYRKIEKKNKDQGRENKGKGAKKKHV
jgi:hypothetical protein